MACAAFAQEIRIAAHPPNGTREARAIEEFTHREVVGVELRLFNNNPLAVPAQFSAFRDKF